jgi:hypothetical protein
MTGTSCDLFTQKSSRSYLNHLVFNLTEIFRIKRNGYVYIFYFDVNFTVHAEHLNNTKLPTYIHNVIVHVSWRLFITKWFKYDLDDLCVNKSQSVPVIFEPPCNYIYVLCLLRWLLNEHKRRGVATY